jgi:hypothetical protein
MALLWAFFAVALGCVLAWSFTGIRTLRPRWAAIMLTAGAGTAGGIGVTSCIYFLCRLIAPGVVWLGIPVELALLGFAVWNFLRGRRQEPQGAPTSTPIPSVLVLLGALIGVLGLGLGAISTSWDSNPGGDWDAWSIWNLRARYLAAPDHLAERAWSPQLTGTHPEYPLLTSGFIARCWAYGGDTADAAPMTTACLFYFALVAIGIGGVAVTRSGSLGILYGLILASTPLLVHEATVQYADVPLACYMLGAALLAAADQPVLAGLFAGFAAWTKDEGMLFLVIFLIAVAIFRRGQIWRVVMGAAAPLALVVLFKLVLVHGTESLPARSLHGMGARIADWHRYGFAGGAIAGALAAMGAAMYHPIYPAAVLAALLRFERGRRRAILFCTLLSVAMLAGYLAIYVVSPDDIRWLVGTTSDRLAIQVWPLLLLILFAALRTPESMMKVPEPATVMPARGRAARKKR